jgi:hypothetical protein
VTALVAPVALALPRDAARAAAPATEAEPATAEAEPATA